MPLPVTSRSTLAILAILTVGLFGGIQYDSANAESASPVGPKLTPKLRDLIRQEMAQMLDSANAITTAIVTGDHKTVADEATKIVNGFILKRSLTEKDQKDLKKAVPPEFLKLDAAFHRDAGKLVEAANNKYLELEIFYFSQMLEDCTACHSTYASDRFPDFPK
jgi:hypothetical protein